MTDIELALAHYDGNGDMPYCDLVWKALKFLQKYGTADAENRLIELPVSILDKKRCVDTSARLTMIVAHGDGGHSVRVEYALKEADHG